MREKNWLGSKDSNLDCMIQSHESCHPCDGGEIESTESAVKLRFRTEDEERGRAHRKSLNNQIIRGKHGVPEREQITPGVIKTAIMIIKDDLFMISLE